MISGCAPVHTRCLSSCDPESAFAGQPPGCNSCNGDGSSQKGEMPHPDFHVGLVVSASVLGHQPPAHLHTCTPARPRQLSPSGTRFAACSWTGTCVYRPYTVLCSTAQTPRLGMLARAPQGHPRLVLPRPGSREDFVVGLGLSGVKFKAPPGDLWGGVV